MLKQSPSRNLRAKRLKVKHALQIFVLVAICIWFIYQVKQSSYFKNGDLEVRDAELSEMIGEDEQRILKMGRKHLRPQLEEIAAEFDKHDEEMELEDEESKVKGNEGEENIEQDEELDTGDKEKSEEAEHDQLQDFIDEDDKDR